MVFKIVKLISDFLWYIVTLLSTLDIKQKSHSWIIGMNELLDHVVGFTLQHHAWWQFIIDPQNLASRIYPYLHLDYNHKFM